MDITDLGQTDITKIAARQGMAFPTVRFYCLFELNQHIADGVLRRRCDSAGFQSVCEDDGKHTDIYGGAHSVRILGKMRGEQCPITVQKRIDAVAVLLCKRVKIPIGNLIECGFLSNWEEAGKLCDERYQEKVAWAIHIGIMQYLNSED